MVKNLPATLEMLVPSLGWSIKFDPWVGALKNWDNEIQSHNFIANTWGKSGNSDRFYLYWVRHNLTMEQQLLHYNIPKGRILELFNYANIKTCAAFWTWYITYLYNAIYVPIYNNKCDELYTYTYIYIYTHTHTHTHIHRVAKSCTWLNDWTELNLYIYLHYAYYQDVKYIIFKLSRHP